MGAARLGRREPLLRRALIGALVAGCSSSSGPIDAPSPSPSGGDWWRPAPGTSWQWQLSGPIDTSVEVDMYDVDLFEASDAVIAELRGKRRIVICYFSAGTHEPGRPDTGDVPAEAVGAALPDWPDERWFDVRHPAVRALVGRRLDRAVSRGCDGVEPDNVDAYSNRSGFPLTGDDQLAFNRFIAREAHARKLSVGLKNDLAQIPALVGDFDWALDEECAEYDECDALLPFVTAGKAVFHVEYGEQALAGRVCADANRRNFDTLVKHLDLDAWRVACR